MRNVCKCGRCDYCKAFLQYEMDLEFGTGGHARRPGNTEVERMVNRLHFEQTEEMCREFGTAGTTREQRAARWQPMSDGPVPGVIS